MIRNFGAAIFGVGLVVFAATTVLAQSGTNLSKTLPPRGPAHTDEHIVMPQFPSGWIEQPTQTGPVEIVEYIPKDQTLETWRDKITLEIHHDTTNLPLDAFQRRALALFRENCDGVVEGRLQTGVNNGFPSAFWTLGCKKDKRGNFGETRYTKAVQGNETLYMLSRSWRTPPFPAGLPAIEQSQVEEAVRFLTTAVICANSPNHACPEAPAPTK